MFVPLGGKRRTSLRSLGANHALIEGLADKGRQIQLVYMFIINVLLGEIGSIEGLNADLASVLL